MPPRLSNQVGYTSKDLLIVSGNSVIFTNMPAAVTELNTNTSRRRYFDLRDFVLWRLHTGVATVGLAGSALGVQFSPDDGANWYALDSGTLNAQSTSKQILDNLGYFVTTFTVINQAARIQNCLLRVVGDNGDGVADPAMTQIIIEVLQ